ncbi:MAG: hypothetical protein COB66_06295 [Coxiella sp. (in: Bacteria)]|nr:MAG: hypothetical protein COB66_06295 [Coxiella sp. (in: g-proteobacteria)]
MKPIHLLIIDDNEDDRVLYKRLLSKDYGEYYTISEAINGEEGLTICKNNPPDCVLLDYDMPDMNGIEWVEKIMIDLEVSIPIVMLTGQGNKELAKIAIQKGIIDYVVKSNITTEGLHRIIDTTIEKSKLLDQVAIQKHELETLAHSDHLTGLKNRFSFEAILDEEIKRSKQQHLSFALLFLDLDDFKRVNGEFGHDVGDLLLNEVAFRLTHALHENDTLARFGGDEFAILLENITHIRYAGIIADKLIHSLDKTYVIDEKEVSAKASIGIACYPEAGTTRSELLKSADMAMYHAKGKGKSCFKYFTENLNTKFNKQIQLQHLSNDSIINDECHLLYQPIYNTTDLKIVSVEALIRWNHPTLGIIEPDEFIPIAEQSGTINSIGSWVLEHALDQYSDWIHNQLRQPLKIAINVSPSQLLDKQFVALLKRLVSQYSLDPTNITIELTETAIMRPNDILDSLVSIDSLNIKIAIDDFGTGFSSLRHLCALPIDVIKIDKSFVQSIHSNPNMAKMVKSIIAMAQNLELAVVAEGVTTKEQFQFLQENGCDYVQGFYLSKPLNPNEVSKLLCHKK